MFINDAPARFIEVDVPCQRGRPVWRQLTDIIFEMRVLITGSSGQVGTNLSLALLEHGHTVLGADISPNKWTDSVETQLVDLVAVARGSSEFSAPWDPDCIVHLAAWAKVYEVTLAPAKALENVEMTFVALELARRTQSPIVLASSREVYGDVLRHVTDEALADFVIAESPYSASKIGSEAFVYSYARCFSLSSLVFRFSNVYGRYDNDLDRMERVIPLFVRSIANAEPITVFGKSRYSTLRTLMIAFAVWWPASTRSSVAEW